MLQYSLTYLLTYCTYSHRPEYKMLQYQPSVICASAVYLALKTSGQTPWVRTPSCTLSPAACQHRPARHLRLRCSAPCRRLPASPPPHIPTFQPARLPPSLPPCFSCCRLSLPRRTRCGAGAADCRAPEAFDLHGGRPAGLYCTYSVCVLDTHHTYMYYMHTTTGLRARHTRHPCGCGDPQPTGCA